MVDHGKLPTGVRVENFTRRIQIDGAIRSTGHGDAGDIVPVRVNTHLLAWPRDLGKIAPMSTSFFLLEAILSSWLACDSHFW